jgi:hypothetical protein
MSVAVNQHTTLEVVYSVVVAQGYITRISFYVYDYIQKVCREQVKVIQNHENAMFAILEKWHTGHRKYKEV